MGLVDEHGETRSRAVEYASVEVEERGHGAHDDAVAARKGARQLARLARLAVLVGLAFGVNYLDGPRRFGHVEHRRLKLAVDDDAVGDDEHLAEE